MTRSWRSDSLSAPEVADCKNDSPRPSASGSPVKKPVRNACPSSRADGDDERSFRSYSASRCPVASRRLIGFFRSTISLTLFLFRDSLNQLENDSQRRGAEAQS